MLLLFMWIEIMELSKHLLELGGPVNQSKLKAKCTER
jgi:hypothetical protein